MSDKVWFSKIGQWTDDAGEVMGANEYPTPNNTMGTTTPDAVVILTTEYERLKAIAERAADAEGIRKVLAMAIGDEHCYTLGSEEVSRWLLTGEVKAQRCDASRTPDDIYFLSQDGVRVKRTKRWKR